MRWNSHSFRKEGFSKGYDVAYLEALVRQGNLSSAERMPVIFSLSHLANLSKTLYSDLHGFVSREDIFREDFPYKNFTIGKRSGGRRWISVPVPPLMAVQKWMAQNIINNFLPHPAAFAYVRNRRILDHAQRHCGADWILKVDIKDFLGVFLSGKFLTYFCRLNIRDCCHLRWLDYALGSHRIGKARDGAILIPIIRLLAIVLSSWEVFRKARPRVLVCPI
ncbi:hypothetical protein WJ969_07460 [Achromobacter xylosoxidans]